jgi:hypothetical protein
MLFLLRLGSESGISVFLVSLLLLTSAERSADETAAEIFDALGVFVPRDADDSWVLV